MRKRKCSTKNHGVAGSSDLVLLLDAYLNQAAALIESLKSEQAEAWETSETAMVAKGRELGLEARPGESLQDFRARIHAANAINHALSGARAVQTSAASSFVGSVKRDLCVSRTDANALDHKWKVGLPNLVESLGATMMQSRIPFLCLLGCYLNAAPHKVSADLVEHLVKIGYGEDLEGTLGEIVDHGI